MTSSKFIFTTLLRGRHTVCILKTGKATQPIRIKVEQGIEEVHAEEKFVLSDEDKFLPVEAALNKTIQKAAEVHKKMDSLSKSEADQKMKSTGTMMILLGLLSVSIVIGSALLQVYYLKKFFKRRKIL